MKHALEIDYKNDSHCLELVNSCKMIRSFPLFCNGKAS